MSVKKVDYVMLNRPYDAVKLCDKIDNAMMYYGSPNATSMLPIEVPINASEYVLWQGWSLALLYEGWIVERIVDEYNIVRALRFT